MTKLLLSLLSVLFLSSLSCKAKDDPLESYVQSHTDFAFSLYHNLDQEEQPLLFSPYSLGSCLNMVYLGARDETASQMQDVLRLKLGTEQIKTASSQLITNLQGNFTLDILSTLFVDPRITLLEPFQVAMKEGFQATLEPIDFNEPQNATQTINATVKEATRGKIPSLFSPTDLNADTRLVLVNALYFKGAWVSAFKPELTHEEPFFTTAKKQAPALMMEKTENLLYYENDHMQMGALPFKGRSTDGTQIALVTMMPKTTEDFEMVLEETKENLDSWLSSLSMRYIHLKIPKWTHSFRFDLNNTLQEMGMQDAFNPFVANFSGITGNKDLCLQKVVHQVEFVVDEEGVVAAAATGASFSLTSAFFREEPIPYYLNRPFLYFLIDLNSHELLFMGKYIGPS